METFDANWLALREPMDHRSRATTLLMPLQAAWQTHGWCRILDLGSGTGSNLRYLAPRLRGEQDWTLLDHDADLLDLVEIPESINRARFLQGDLADQGLAAIAQVDFATGSTLLDLVSKEWFEQLVNACRSISSGALFVLTYDGDIQWVSGSVLDDNVEDPDDAFVRQAVNAHQRRDKGLCSALGPTAASVAAKLFQEAGYRTWLASSTWRLGPQDSELARALVDGWEAAASEKRPDHAGRIHGWACRRRQVVASEVFVLTVGHLDLLALPSFNEDLNRRACRLPNESNDMTA